MLVRKENENEIWTDTIKKGTGKKSIITDLIGMVIFTMLMVMMKCDFSNIETYYVLGFLFLPCFIILICGFIFIKKENNKYLVAKVNNSHVILYKRKDKKQINIQQIIKIKMVSSSIGSFVIIFYNDNEKECKYSFEVSASNKNLLAIAIKEYNNNVEINDSI